MASGGALLWGHAIGAFKVALGRKMSQVAAPCSWGMQLQSTRRLLIMD